MNEILVSHSGQNKTCTIEEISIDFKANTGTLKIKGWAIGNLSTIIPINKIGLFLVGDPVDSIYGYFSVQIKNEETRLELKKLWL